MIDALEAQGSLVRAAAALGLGQPALTRSLAEAEAIAGEKLFERHPRGVRPTEAGLVMARLARHVLAELRRADQELDRIGQVAAIGALPVAAVGVLPGALIRLRASHPRLLIRVQQGRMEELLPLLAAGEIDLIIGRLYAPATPDSFVREALWEEPIAIIARAGHPLLRAQGGPALADCEMVLPTVSQRVGQEIDQLLGLLGLGGAALRSSSYGFIREMLLATDMVSVMPRSMMAGDLLRGTLRPVPLPVAAPPRPAGIILPARPPSPAARAFCEALRAHVAELAAQGITDMPKADTSGQTRHATGGPEPG